MAADLHLTSPRMHDTTVTRLQQKLTDLGYHPGKIDGIYGDATAGAVRSFQKAHRLRVDGIVGEKTRAALGKAKRLPQPQKPSSIGVKALAEALKHLGVRERPLNSNKQKFGVWFGLNGVPWCAIFVSYCFDVGAATLLGRGLTPAQGGYRRGVAYVPTLESWLRSRGKWVGRTTPHPGDIAIFNWDGGVADHVGIVEKYLGNGKFLSIEGNTAVGNDSNGGEVMRRERNISQVDGFGRL
jgi:cell wall-associated NlpC family hydrolase